jgi:hypothetical protein
VKVYGSGRRGYARASSALSRLPYFFEVMHLQETGDPVSFTAVQVIFMSRQQENL